MPLLSPQPAEAVEAQRRRRLSHPLMYRFLWTIRQEWKLLGFFEVNQKHPFYGWTCMLKKGLRASVQEAIDRPAAPSESDFTAVLKQSHEGYQMRTYAGPVFARFRHFLGMADQDYQQSLSCDSPYLQFVGNSKSSADFFLTNDKRFFLKTQHKREIRFLLTQLPKYLDHMEKYPHSILVKFLGKKRGWKYFIIMQSIFYPHERIIERYDIKGCQVDRWSEVAPEGSNVTVILKDLNFGEKAIHLDQQRPWLVHQVELDTQFLKDLDVMDYSILVGLQPLREDERILNQALIDIIARTVLHSMNSSSCLAQNRRFLPSCRNPLHVIDGPEYRYFIGIVDLFTVYSFCKKLEHLWKSIRHCGKNFSTINPSCYARRLCQWVEDHTT
uniref:Phosphatidylinositol-4-phosphate 5-kinase like 1 n=1 Tax=Varanus komodoensis TaxID=61221 RepID=A0A8D2LU40_VARKO